MVSRGSCCNPLEVEWSIPVLLRELKTICRSRNLEQGRELHSVAIKTGYMFNLKVASALIDMYSKCGGLDEALKIFNSMHNPDVVSWTTLIQAYARNGQGDIALDFFSRMISEGFQPNSHTFVAALKACTTLANHEQGVELDGKLLKLKSLERGMFLHASASQNDQTGNLFVGNSLLDMYSKCGDLEGACRVIDRMPCRSLVSWTSLLLGHAQNGEEEAALIIFEGMLGEQHLQQLDRSSFLAVFRACVGLAGKEPGEEVEGRLVKPITLERTMALHSQAAQHCCDAHRAVANNLVTLYSKCGSLEDSRRVFDRILQPDLFSWTSLISGCVENNEPETGLGLFLNMEAEPDENLLVVALQACTSLASLEFGKMIHAHICKTGIECDPVVSNALVDFYGKCGSIIRAQLQFDLVSRTSSSTVSWNALLAGYSQQGDSEAVLGLFHRMWSEDIQPSSITFLSVLTSCSRGGLVEEGKKCFREMLTKHRVAPGIEHYHCLLDLLGRKNQLELAVSIAEEMPFESTEVTWITLLASAKKWRSLKVARLAFDSLLALDTCSCVEAAYKLMLGVYGSLGMRAEQLELERSRATQR